MRLVTFDHGDGNRPGVLLSDGVLDITPTMGVTSMSELLGRFDELRDLIGRVTDSPIPLGQVRLAPPLRPRAIMATGANYLSHISELGATPPPTPTANFVKLPGSLCGHLSDIAVPEQSFVDYEGEIAVVIGAPARSVPEDQVWQGDRRPLSGQ